MILTAGHKNNGLLSVGLTYGRSLCKASYYIAFHAEQVFTK